MKNRETASRLTLALSIAGLRPQDLADRSGVSKASISQYINGSHAPSNLSAGKMAEVLGVSPVWLMGFNVDMTSENSAQIARTTPAEQTILDKYRALSPTDRARIEERMDEMLEKKTSRMEDNINVG